MGCEVSRARSVGRWIVPGLMAVTLAACGGGGNGNVRPTPVSPPPPPPPTTTTDQPPADAQLSITDTYAAHDAGYTGAGVIIGMVDSGVMRSNPTVAGRVKAELIYVDKSANNTSIDDVVGHGTWTSEIAAGTSFDDFPGGIAPGADLVSARIISDNAPDDHGQPPAVVTDQDAQYFGQVNSDLIQNDVNVMNNSWGGITWDTSDASVNQAFDDAYSPFVNQHGGLVVFAAGNDSDPNPSTIAALPSVAPDLEKGWLTVVAVDSNHPTQLDSYSNKCGIAMDYCLAAPGDVIVLDKDTTASTTDPKYWVVSGTSLSAPQVSGAAALVWQAFPYFSNDLVRQTILGTADPLGGSQPNTTFGYGELDVGKAVQGPAQFNWGDVSVSFDGLTSTWSNDISGAGGLIKNGSGTLVLAGNDTYTGSTQVLGGSLQAAHDLAGDVTVGSGGTLDAVPGLQGALANSGTVVVRGGNTDVGGNYTQTSTGTLSVSLGSELAIIGSAQLAGTLNVLGADSGYVTSQHQDVLTAMLGVNGTFAQFTQSPGVFLSTTIQYTSDSVWLDTTSLSITQTAAAVGIVSPASVGAAVRVQDGFNTLDSKITSGATPAGGVLQGASAIQHAATVASARATLQSLSGQLHAASAAMLFDSIDANGRTLSARFADLLDGSAKPGTWLGNPDSQGNLQRAGYAGATFRSDGDLVGADFRLGSHALFGYAAGESRGYGQLDASWDHSRTWADHVMVYGGLFNGPWYAGIRAGGGWFHQDMQRLLLLGGLSAPVGSQASGTYLSGALEGGFQFHAGTTRITPFADVRYQHLDQGGFSEQGGYGFGLMANERTIGRLQAGLGVRAQRDWRLGSGMWMQFDGGLAWRHALHEYGEAFDASFTAFDNWMPVEGIGLSRDEAVARAGLSLWPTQRLGLRLGYEHQQGQRQRADNVMLQGSLRF